MSNIISAIQDDMDEYEELCNRYNEEPLYTLNKYGYQMLDCYSVHARDLISRSRKERKDAQNNTRRL